MANNKTEDDMKKKKASAEINEAVRGPRKVAQTYYNPDTGKRETVYVDNPLDKKSNIPKSGKGKAPFKYRQEESNYDPNKKRYDLESFGRRAGINKNKFK